MFNGTHKVFSVYGVYPNHKADKPGRRLLGRFVTFEGHIALLEDHSGFLSEMIKDGPITPDVERALESLRHSPYTRVEDESDVYKGKDLSDVPELETEPGSEGPQPSGHPQLVESTEAPAGGEFRIQTPPAVFDYLRVGAAKAQVIEIHEGQVLLNGQLLSPEEIQRVMYNIKTGLASLRYRKAGGN